MLATCPLHGERGEPMFKSGQVVRCALWLMLLGSNGAWAVPAHYVVFEFDAEGHAIPVFHTNVELTVDRTLDRMPESASDTEVERLGYRPIKNGVIGSERRIDVPRFLRVEFARDAESGIGEIEHHANVEDGARAFVLRVPVDEADQIELVTDVGMQHIDLAQIARDSARLPLAGAALANLASAKSTVSDRAMVAANSGNRVDILVLGDGYTAAEQSTFDTHVATLKTAMFDVSPYKDYGSFINWRAGFVTSAQSGADHPPYQAGCTTASCCADTGAQSDPRAGTFVSTALDAKFCTNQIHRLLTVSNSKVYAAAAAYPDWDQILVTVNDSVYGGAGGAYGVTSAHPYAPLIVIHEYGHSFHKLADEYDSPYPGFPACSDLTATPTCEPNVTNQTNASLVKWRSWFTPGIAIPTPSGTAGTGLFQGARYLSSGMYRPVDNTCLMRSLGTNFCPVCRQEYVKRLYRGGFGVPAGGIDLIEPGTESPLPANPVSYMIGTTRLFQAALLRPTIGSIGIQWYLDGVPIPGATTESHAFSQAAASLETRVLELRVTDQTAFVHAEMADGLIEHSRSWTIQVVNDRLFANGFE
jgi:hypothetical protein